MSPVPMHLDLIYALPVADDVIVKAQLIQHTQGIWSK